MLGDGVTTGGINAGSRGGFEALDRIPGGGSGSRRGPPETLTIEIRAAPASRTAAPAARGRQAGNIESSQTGPERQLTRSYGNGGNGSGETGGRQQGRRRYRRAATAADRVATPAGRIHQHTRTGSVVVPAGAVLPPTLGVGATTLGTLRVD